MYLELHLVLYRPYDFLYLHFRFNFASHFWNSVKHQAITPVIACLFNFVNFYFGFGIDTRYDKLRKLICVQNRELKS